MSGSSSGLAGAQLVHALDELAREVFADAACEQAQLGVYERFELLERRQHRRRREVGLGGGGREQLQHGHKRSIRVRRNESRNALSVTQAAGGLQLANRANGRAPRRSSVIQESSQARLSLRRSARTASERKTLPGRLEPFFGFVCVLTC
jgi:hypothetical protein